MAGEKWLQVAQVGKETTEGTAVVATRRLYVNGDFTRERAQNIVKFQTGTRDNTRDVRNRTVAATAKLSQPLIADDMVEWLLGAIKGGVTPTTASGESDWVFTPGNTLDSQTLEFYDGRRPWQMRGGKVAELKLTGGAGKDTMADITYWGRDLVVNTLAGTAGVAEVQSLVDTGASAGQLKLTFLGQTTADIAYNASAAAVQAALELLPSIGTGNVTCTGGPLPTAVVITFAGRLAKVAGLPLIVGSMGTTPLTGGTAVVTRTTAGVDNTPLTDRVPIVIEGWEALLYADAFGGTAGTTLISSTLIDWEVTIKNNPSRKYFLDNTVAVGSVPLGELEIEGSFTYEANDIGISEYYHWDQADKRLFRLDLGNNGAVIGSSAKKPRIIIDLPSAYKAADLSGEDNGTKVYKLSITGVYDVTNAWMVKFTLQTSRATAY
jgi:hypothetical protein